MGCAKAKKFGFVLKMICRVAHAVAEYSGELAQSDENEEEVTDIEDKSTSGAHREMCYVITRLSFHLQSSP